MIFTDYYGFIKNIIINLMIYNDLSLKIKIYTDTIELPNYVNLVLGLANSSV